MRAAEELSRGDAENAEKKADREVGSINAAPRDLRVSA